MGKQLTRGTSAIGTGGRPGLAKWGSGWRRRMTALLASGILALAGACSTPPPPATDSAPPASRPPVTAVRQMVVAAHPLAAEAGRQILNAGGSAVDAAIAAQMVLALVEPQSSGIGGGAFLLHYAAASGAVDAYDGRETAPARAWPEMFLDSAGSPKPFLDAAVGGLSVGVPGLLRMLELAHREHGRLPWAELFKPAIALAEQGFEVSPRLAEAIARDAPLKTMKAAGRYFFHADGSPLAAGERKTNPELAATLTKVALGGANAFYHGPIARDLVRAVRSAPRSPGRLSEADLADYRAMKREAVCARYRVWRICGMPPPSSGGITVLQILKLLEPLPLPAVQPLPTVTARRLAEAPLWWPLSSTIVPALTAHRLAEAGKLAFADRDAYIADPDFVPVPTAGLLDPEYLAERSRLIGSQAMPKAEPGTPPGLTLHASAEANAREGVSTTHLSVVDAEGNAVALTSSIEDTFGSRLMVRGFLLNNQLTDFSFQPTVGGVPVANRVAPLKRPRSSMAPTVVLDAEGRLKAVIGSPGGPRIIGYVARTLIAVLDWELDVQAAIDGPHILNRNGPTEVEENTVAETLVPALRDLGHTVQVRALTSGLHGITVTPTGLAGGADPRREGVAVAD